MTNAVATADPMIEVPKRQFDAMVADLAALREQLEWFKRQVFGVKSEKRMEADAEQASLFAAGQAHVLEGGPAHAIDVPAHQRRKVRTGEEVNDSGLRFGADVPVREIVLPCPELAGPDAGQYELIDHKVSLRLARQPGSHVVLKYLRPVVRRKADGAMTTVAAPLGVLDHAQVDVSFVAGMLVDKFVYHVPLYRQHQRLADEGITLARSSLDAWARRSIDLLAPIARAIWEGILAGGPGQDEDGLAVAGAGRERRYRVRVLGPARGAGGQGVPGRVLSRHDPDRRVPGLCRLRGSAAGVRPRAVLVAHAAGVLEGRGQRPEGDRPGAGEDPRAVRDRTPVA